MPCMGRDGRDGGMCAEQLLIFAVAEAQSVLVVSHPQAERVEGKSLLWDTCCVSDLVPGVKVQTEGVNPRPGGSHSFVEQQT